MERVYDDGMALGRKG